MGIREEFRERIVADPAPWIRAERRENPFDLGSGGGQMRTRRFTDEQIIGIIGEYEAGAELAELCRRHNVSRTTLYEWRARYGAMAASDAKRLKALGEENRPG